MMGAIQSYANIYRIHSTRYAITNCNCSTLNRFDLCCKMGQEYDGFYDSGKKYDISFSIEIHAVIMRFVAFRWWCHFDDDNYVNPSMLVDVLNEYDWTLPLYLGRLSRSNVQTVSVDTVGLTKILERKNLVSRATSFPPVYITASHLLIIAVFTPTPVGFTQCEQRQRRGGLVAKFHATLWHGPHQYRHLLRLTMI